MTFVGMYAETSPACVSMIGSAVSEPPPYFSVDARRALEQPAVEIEYVARIRLAARGAVEHQRDLAISHGVLGKIVKHDQGVHAIVHVPLANRRAGERGEVLVRRRLGRRGRDNGRVRHRAGVLEDGDRAGDVRVLLADGDVDGIDRAEVLRAGLLGGDVDLRLGDDRVERDGRLAGRTVANDQLALAAADRDHRVDGHDAGLHRLANASALDDARRDLFDRIADIRT